MTLVSAPAPLAEVLSSKGWISRGWTYQEAVLSRRLLIFTDYEVYFVCAAMTCSESLVARPGDESAGQGERPIALQSDFFYPGRVALQGHRHPPKSRTLAQQLMAHIEQYSSRKLTLESDALNAFRGILSRWPFCSYYGSPFAVNDPAQRLNPEALQLGFLLFLAWNTTRHGGSRRAHNAFPSWSWSGWAGRVTFDGLYDVIPDAGLPHAQMLPEGPLMEATAVQTAGPRILPELSPHLRIKTLVLQLRFQVLRQQYGHESVLCRCHPCGAHEKGPIYRIGGLGPRDPPGQYWAAAKLDEPPTGVGTLGPWDCVLLFADRFKDWLPTQEVVRRTFLIVRQYEGVAYRVGTIRIVDDQFSTLESLLREVPNEMREIVLG